MGKYILTLDGETIDKDNNVTFLATVDTHYPLVFRMPQDIWQAYDCPSNVVVEVIA